LFSACFTCAGAGLRLDRALACLLPGIGLRGRRRLCENGFVRKNGQALSPAHKVQPGDQIDIELTPMRLNGASSHEPFIISRSENFIAIFKPPLWHSVAVSGKNTRSIDGYLSATIKTAPQKNHFKPCLLSRLDYPTSGILPAALCFNAKQAWLTAQQAGKIEKHYLAVVEGGINAPFVMRNAINTANRALSLVLEQNSPDNLRHTEVEPLAIFCLDGKKLSLAHCIIRKGARHQIRAHLAAAGHPILGDTLYGAKNNYLPDHFPIYLHHACLKADLGTRSLKWTIDPHWLDMSGFLPQDVTHTIQNWLQTIGSADGHA
jgi:23S rRNA pseudouridine1911/1915/1917 synthase